MSPFIPPMKRCFFSRPFYKDDCLFAKVPRRVVRSKGWLSSFKAFIIAPLIFVIVLGGIFAYSGIWPPLVVIESKSMQHSSDTSYIGAIDTGDIVIVKKSTAISDVVTYVEGEASGYSTYGEYGDVIIYYHQGMDKPIIHRAIVELVYNFTGGGFDIPSLAGLPDQQWSVPNAPHQWWNLKESVDIYDVGYMNSTVSLDLASMLEYMNSHGGAHGGIITMGDNNWFPGSDGSISGRYDQKWISSVKEPIMDAWLVGKARGELPWFGLLKLWATNTAPSYTPQNSQNDLIIALALIIIIPVGLDVTNGQLKKRGIHMFGWASRLSPRRLVPKKRFKDDEKPEK
jgi:signal peptidase I